MALISLGAVVPVASASTVTLDGGRLEVTGGGGKNLVTLAKAGSELRITDPGEGVSSGSPGCTTGGGAVTCPVAQVTTIQVDLGNGHDQASVEGELVATVIGGPGNDALRDGAGAGTLIGGGGDDVFVGRGGADRVAGGSGADLIRGGSGRDRLLGGGGNDAVQGGPGRDLLAGGGGIDQFNPGRDRVRDRVNCGGGADFALLFGPDRARGCEFVKRS